MTPKVALEESVTERFNFEFFYKLGKRSNKTILKWCMMKGLIARKYKCPKCNARMLLAEYKTMIDGWAWQCRKTVNGKKHRVNRSIRRGSWFYCSQLSLIKVLHLTYMWVAKYKQWQIKYELRVASQTIVDWIKFSRLVCVNACLNESSTLGGENRTVELNECVFDGQKYSSESSVKGAWIVWGVERGSKKFFFEVVKEKSKTMLLDVIQKWINVGSTIISDFWKEYGASKDEEFQTLAVNYSWTLKSLETKGQNCIAKTLWNSIKHSLRGIKPAGSHIDAHLAECLWRRSHANNPNELFASFIKEVAYSCEPRTRDEGTESSSDNSSCSSSTLSNFSDNSDSTEESSNSSDESSSESSEESDGPQSFSLESAIGSTKSQQLEPSLKKVRYEM